MGRAVALVICALLLAASCNAASNATSPAQNSRDVVLHADLRFLGSQVLPLTDQKQNAIIVGVANVLGGGILASDITLAVLSTYDSISATGGRKLLQQNQTYPAADIGLNISTSNAQAGNQAATLKDASNKTYALASAIGAQGLQTQQIVLQSTDITQNAQTPPPTPSPPPSLPAPQGSPPSPSPPPAATPSPSPTAAAAGSGSASSNSASASTKSGSGSSLSGGAIAGIIVGAVALLALAVLAAVLAKRRSKRKMAQQEEVIEYFSGRDKQGPNAGNMIHANSSSHIPPAEGARESAPVIRPAPPMRLNIPNSAISNIDEKAEHGLSTDKREVV